MKPSIIVATLIIASQNPNGKPTAPNAYSIYRYATMFEQWSFWQQLRAEGDPDGNDWFGRFTGWDANGYPRPAPVTLADLFGLDYAPDSSPDLDLEPGFGLHPDYTPPPFPRFAEPSTPVTQQSSEPLPQAA